ncbi:MAG TPA: hypothetical protein VH277_09750 [Gemmatimonadaceae bacterium]|jgi:hypothetical protein|nr:hypothetical protein [Gemmatimonadaceae bacterium]
MRALATLLLAAAAVACSGVANLDGDFTNPPQPTTISGAFRLSGNTTYVRDASPRLQFAVTVMNPGTTPSTVTYGGCWLYLRLYSTADRGGTPAYDQSKHPAACSALQQSLVVPPGDSVVIVQDFISPATLAPAGHYFASLLVAPNGVATSIASGDVTFP